ncbi:MAG: anti-sigma factor antagonist [Calditrichaeota bacterium]|nr:STAS domain-containing protein [Calditrichota bacterium]RQW04619.1 MAG: anti-sigma factor antagonist [Calditrichota bacterium]
MKIKEDIKGNIAVLTISGNMMGGPETTELHDKVKSLMGDGIKKIVIDLAKVKWMNSSGLGVLMAVWGSLKKEGGNLKLANVSEKINSLFMITQLVQFFETFESVDRALATLQ